MQKYWLLIFFFMLMGLDVYAQQTQTPDTIKLPANLTAIDSNYSVYKPDSAALAQARAERQADSAAVAFLYPSPDRPNKFVDSLLHHDEKLFANFDFLKMPVRAKSSLMEGRGRPQRDQWIIAITAGLLLYMCILRIFLGKDVDYVLQSFFSKRVLSQASKEEGFINTWAFLALFLLFGLTFGLFLYQASSARGHYFSVSGIQLFLFLSVVILAVFAVKFLVLKFIGHLFNISKPVSEYLAVLNLTYFNIGFVFLAICVCFSLIDVRFTPYLLYITIVLVVVIFLWQYLRSSVALISNFRFRKIYLIIYLCALEICPVLILIKALNI